MKIPPLYTVQLLKTFKTDDGRTYKAGSWQYAWVDSVGFICLRGWHSGWEFSSCAHPGVDFAWYHGEDPRSLDEIAKYEVRFQRFTSPKIS